MRRWAAALKAAALCAGVCAGLLWAVPARASVVDLVEGLVTMNQMAKPPGDNTHNQQRELLVNGFPLHVSTGRTDRRTKEVIDFYQSRYPGGAMKQITGGRPFGLRQEGPKNSMLLTVDVPDRPTALRVANGKQSLFSAGPLRMVYAHRMGLYTEYLVAWSDSPVPMGVFQRVASMDAPGHDIPGVPRPLGMRSLDFEEPKAGYRLAIYKVSDPPEQALQTTISRMESAGWQQDANFGAAASKKHDLAARFTKGERQDVMVKVSGPKGKEPGSQVIYLARDLS
jgi:hypothetical protein